MVFSLNNIFTPIFFHLRKTSTSFSFKALCDTKTYLWKYKKIYFYNHSLKVRSSNKSGFKNKIVFKITQKKFQFTSVFVTRYNCHMLCKSTFFINIEMVLMLLHRQTVVYEWTSIPGLGTTHILHLSSSHYTSNQSTADPQQRHLL